MKREKFPLIITAGGVSVKIRKVSQTKNGTTYCSFAVDYVLLGKRKMAWRANLEEAKAAASEICVKISNGEQFSLELKNGDRLAYLRATEALTPVHVPIDVACREYAGALHLLDGKCSVLEACREWVKRNLSELPKIAITDACEKIKLQANTDRKSQRRQQQLSAILDRFAADVRMQVHQITPDIVSRWLAGLPLAERTRRNYRDVIGFFCRFLIRCGFLPKGTDWLENVQQYRARKIGTISTYEPGEMRALLEFAFNSEKETYRAMVPFLAIGAFAGLRHSEINRLDWKQIDLEDGFIEVLPVAGTKSDERRRLVPIKENLKKWLLLYRKDGGKVCPFANSTKQLLKIAADSTVAWKHNALRHSCISYRVAECGDVARVADESGNSVHVIRTNYLRRMKPAQALEWFSIEPLAAKILTLNAPSIESSAMTA